MKKILIILVLLFSSSVVAEEISVINLNEGANDYEAKAIAEALGSRMAGDFYDFIQESLVGGYGAPPHSINYKVDFYTKSIDLNNDDSDEVIVWYSAPTICGSGGCWMFILGKDPEGKWSSMMIEVFGGNFKISDTIINQYHVLYHIDALGVAKKCTVNEYKKYICKNVSFEEDKHFSFSFAGNEFHSFSNYKIFQPNSSGKKFYYYADCPTRWGGYFFLFSIENNQPVFHSRQDNPTYCMDKISIEDKKADGVDELVILARWYASGSGGEEEQIFFYKDEEFEIYRYPKSEWQTLGIGGESLGLPVDFEIRKEIQTRAAELYAIGVDYNKETKIIISDNAFPSDGSFKRQNTETYRIESIASKDIEFILRVSESIIKNSEFKIVGHCNKVVPPYGCLLKREY